MKRNSSLNAPLLNEDKEIECLFEQTTVEPIPHDLRQRILEATSPAPTVETVIPMWARWATAASVAVATALSIASVVYDSQTQPAPLNPPPPQVAEFQYSEESDESSILARQMAFLATLAARTSSRDHRQQRIDRLLKEISNGN